MKTKKLKCQNKPNQECVCTRKLGWTKWLYMIPIALCCAFSLTFMELERVYQKNAFDVLAEDNHKVFNALHNISVNHINQFGQEAATFYNDSIVPQVSNTDFTFSRHLTQPDSLVDGVAAHLGCLDLLSDTASYDLRLKDLGHTRVYKYKYNDDTYWIFGTYDGDMIAKQRNLLALFVFLMLLSTTVLNVAIIYKINQSIYGAK
jgi:hypothetical protein